MLAATAALASCASLTDGGLAKDSAAAKPPANGAASPPVAALWPPGAASAPARAPAAGLPPARPASGAAAASAPTPPAPPAPGTPPPFATIIKDAKRSDGLLPVWRKDDKFWLEIPAALLDQPLLFSANISHAVGERRLHGSTMGPAWLVSFVKVGQSQIQLQALNTEFVASGKPQQHTLAQNFSRSLLNSMAIASAPHPESKALLVDASFLLSDIPSYGRALEAAYRLPYALDRGNSNIRSTNTSAEQTSIATNMHFFMPRLPLPPLMPMPMPMPTAPSTLPDARSMLIGYVYNFVKLPATPMKPREADGRIGHFYDTVTDFTADLKLRQRVNYINRWRLERKDAAAALSEPVKPITFWIDKNVPLEYRASVKAGVLEWNKAFEKIGFKDAIVVQQQADDAEFDTLDGTHASIRWYFGLDSGSATGPSHSDPRTGEILDADIRIGDDWARYARGLAVEQTQPSAASFIPDAPFATLSERNLDRLTAPWRNGRGAERHAFCSYGEAIAGEFAFAMEALAATDALAPDSPQAEALVQAVIKDVVTHEVGHTLGLKHNFKGSTVFTQDQLADPAFTESNGVGSSVMDYAAYNLPLPGEARSRLLGGGIGVYDHWAIEYAYRPLDAKTETEELERIAARSTEPLLAFADDMDSGGDGFDPKANRFDLGADPLTYVERRMKLTQALWKRAETWQPRPGEGSIRQRNMLAAGFGQMRNAVTLASKFVGGMHAVREVPGTAAAAARQAAYVPVDTAEQRRALSLLTQGLFVADAFRFPAKLVANISPDYVEFERRDPVSIPASVLRVQGLALDRLMSGSTAQRLLEQPLFLEGAARSQALTLAEVYATLQRAVWSELATGGETESMRRNLQREHLKRVQLLLTRGGAIAPADALSLVRLYATELQAQLLKVSKSPRLSVESRAHLLDSLSGLNEALKANMQRS